MYTLVHNNITYTVQAPVYPINQIVDHYVIIKGQGLSIPDRLFPNNKTEIFFNLGDKVPGINNIDASRSILDDSTVSGVRSSFFDFVSPQNYFMVGLRFSLFGFGQLFKIPATDFTDKNFSTREVWGREMTFLRERLYDASQNNERLINVLNEWIMGYLAKRSLSEISQWNRLEQKFGIISLPVSELLNRYVGYTHKHAIQLIKNNSGLAPKHIQKVNRFNRAIRIISSSFQSWGQVANEVGYADQSHLIREFRLFSGYTPEEYLLLKPKEYRKNMLLKHEELQGPSR
jgi:AraC-like DNA-binding protein